VKVKRALCAGAALVALGVPVAGAQAAERPPAVPNAQAAIVLDGRDGDVMFAKGAMQRRQMASTTKLMTALLTLENARPKQVFAAADYDAAPIESQIGLRPGEQMTVADLLEALLLESANDAAVTLAEGISGTREAFVAAMNARAEQLGLKGTSYANPIGFDDPLNYSTARDLAKLALELMQRPRFARIVDLPLAELESGARPRLIDNRNTLIASYPFVSGVKTGHTMQAGYVLIGAGRNRAGGRVISVVMGEPSEPARDADTLALLRWGLSRFERVRVLDRRRAVARAAIEYSDERAELVPARNASVTVRDGEQVRRRVRAPDQLEGPVPAGARVGTVTVLVDGERARRVGLVTAGEIPEAGTLKVLFTEVGLVLTLLIAAAVLLGAVLVAMRLRVRFRLVKR
jgi:serine-type D-Ala-D-Ala carboxypeptidase (penicillin-binding protein 5/6)